MAEQKDVLAVGSGATDILVQDKDLELVIAEADKRVEILKKVLGVAIKRTNPKDWVDQQGHPYLTASGAEKIAPLFGVKMNNLVDKCESREDDKGKYYMYTMQATFSWKAGSIEAIGTCTSRDKFFAWNSSDKTYKPLSQVDESNIKKAAYSNMMVNGITRVLGIRNLTWDDLKGYGIEQGAVAKVEYKDKQTDYNFISEPQRKRLFAITKESGVSDEEVKELLKTKYGITTSKEIKREHYENVIEDIKALKKGG